jgi:antitoxin (DNA-binding transcriptional repressor) of toxin-antitoxin stability system
VELPFDADLKAFADGGFMALFDDEGIQTDVSAGRRGVNVTTLDAESGRVLSMSGFDTTANEWESAALAEHIAQVEEGNIVLVASNGDATAHLTPQAVNALRAIGADVSMETLHGNYFAIVGVQGKQSGKAAQVVDPNEAYLSLSLDRDHRPLAAAVDTVTIRRESSAQP